MRGGAWVVVTGRDAGRTQAAEATLGAAAAVVAGDITDRDRFVSLGLARGRRDVLVRDRPALIVAGMPTAELDAPL